MAELSPEVAAPVVTETPAAEAAPAPDATAAPVEIPEGEKPEAKPERTFSQKELDDIVQRRLAKESKRSERLGEERARREAAERELERVRAERAPQRQSEGEPDPKDFADFATYNKAVIAYHVDRGIAEKLAAQTKESNEQQQNRSVAEYAKHVQSKVQAAKAKYEDFQDVIDGGVYTEPMTAFIAQVAKDGGELAYYLGNHRDEAIRIAQLSPAAQIVEMHLIESKMSAPPTTTKTPPPIVPTGTKAQVDRDPGKMTDKEFNDWRKRQIAQRR